MRRALVLVSLGLAAAPAAARADAPATGRLLVTLRAGAGQHVTAAAVAATAAARPAGYSVPQIRLVTLRPRPGRSLRALAARLRADGRVALVRVEHRARPRFDPNDPALTMPETAPGTAPGTPVEWWAARSGFPQAWGISTGAGATVAVIDTGAETSHPELADRIAGTVSFDPQSSASSVDSVGHGTHVASLACGAGNNGIGLAGAGLRCQLLVIKSDFSDSSVAKAIVWAVDHGADAINMSFGTDPGPQPSQAVRDAVDYAVEHNVVLAAAAADSAIAEQGYPADLLQPSGTGPNLSVGKGLSVTAADVFDRRAPFAGEGSQISVAAYGTYDASGNGPPGIFGAFTAGPNELETGAVGLPPRPPCSCRTTFAGDPRYAYVQGTSMATPMVAATGALMRHLNPDLTSEEIVQVIKQTARRPAGTGWTSDLGWGILDAGAALTRTAALDRRAPRSHVRALAVHTTSKSTITLRWAGSDPAPKGVRSSGISRFELWRSTNGSKFRRLLTAKGTSRRVTLRRGAQYRFYTVAVDHAGNREAAPAAADVRVTRRA